MNKVYLPSKDLWKVIEEVPFLSAQKLRSCVGPGARAFSGLTDRVSGRRHSGEDGLGCPVGPEKAPDPELGTVAKRGFGVHYHHEEEAGETSVDVSKEF